MKFQVKRKILNASKVQIFARIIFCVPEKNIFARFNLGASQRNLYFTRVNIRAESNIY